MQATIAELWIYPVKGCAGISLKTAQALRTGLQYDRRWMVVAADTGKFITQRTHPQMALIRTALGAAHLALNFPNKPACLVPLNAMGAAKTVTVWNSTLSAIDAGNAAAQWLSEVLFGEVLSSNFLTSPVRLVQFDDAQTRAVREDSFEQHKHQFADGFPYLVLSQASVVALNERLLENGSFTVDTNRFRANIILADVDAHTEDFTKTLTHPNGAVFDMVKSCTRCGVPNIDQSTGKTHPSHEPNLTLAQYRYDKAADGVIFGMNAVISQAATLAVGDVLNIQLDF